MGGEVFAWREGQIYLYTGISTASALIAYAVDMDIRLQNGIENYQTMNTAYHNRWTGRRADVQIGTLYTVDRITLYQMAALQSAIIHIHAKQSNTLGSAGVLLYSGAIDTISLAGREGDFYQWSLSYHANRWSVY